MIALEKRMDGTTDAHVNDRSDVHEVLKTIETFVSESEKKIDSNANYCQSSQENYAKKIPLTTRLVTVW